MGFGKDNKGAILRESTTLTIGAIASGAAAIAVTDITLTEDFRLMKSEINAHVIGLTSGEGAGLVFGIANGALSAAEIQAALIVDGPTGPSDRPAAEVAERRVKVLGMVRKGTLPDTEMAIEGHNGSLMIVHKGPWTYTNTDKWDWFLFNFSGGNITTGASVRILATHYGMWLT